MGWFLRARARARGIGIIRKTAAAATGRPFVLNNDRGNRALIPLFADCFPSPPPSPLLRPFLALARGKYFRQAMSARPLRARY